jgi:hypothetical protein
MVHRRRTCNQCSFKRVFPHVCGRTRGKVYVCASVYLPTHPPTHPACVCPSLNHTESHTQYNHHQINITM